MEVRVETLKCQGGFLALSCGKKSWMNGDNILEGVRSGSSRDEEAPSHFLSVNFSAQPQTYSVRHPFVRRRFSDSLFAVCAQSYSAALIIH